MSVETHTWVSADGTTTVMNDSNGIRVGRDIKGRLAPTFRVTEDNVPFEPGVVSRNIQHDARTITMPVSFLAGTSQNLWDNLHVWETLFDPTRGPSRWRVTDPSGTTRELIVSVTAGMELDESQGLTAGGIAKTALTLRAAWPYWQDVSDVNQVFGGGTVANFFPIFPLRLSGSETFSSITLSNVGDENAWPVWTITGPASNIVMTNQTSTRALAWGGVLGNGETLTIDTRPKELAPATRKTVLLGDGTDQFTALTSWDMWPLVPGTNTISVSVDGSTNATSVQLSFRQNYRKV